MWQKAVKKTLFTLSVDDYAPDITALTFPLMKFYAKRIGADFHIINTRKFPGYPPAFEKLQIHRLAQEMENEWNIFFDADTLIHPETIDFTQFIPKDTVAHNGNDMAALRWKYDRFILRDGRHFGSCNWCAIASDWCVELWEPPTDQTLSEALENIYPTVAERNTGLVDPEHLLDDYTLSRNIAKYGLKTTTLIDVLKKAGLPDASFFEHHYTIDHAAKVTMLKARIGAWGISHWPILT